MLVYTSSHTVQRQTEILHIWLRVTEPDLLLWVQSEMQL